MTGEATSKSAAQGGVTPKTADRVTDRRDRALYVISVAAELAGVHPQTLRFYERKGLIAPSRTAGRNRRYSDRDIERVRIIQSLTQGQGMTITACAMVLEMESELADARKKVSALMAEMEGVRRRFEEQIEAVRRSYRAELAIPRDVRPPMWGEGKTGR